MNPEEKWHNELENGDLVLLDFLVPGLPDDWYADEDNLLEALGDAMDAFVARHHYSSKTWDNLINNLLVRDAYYKALENAGVKLPCDKEESEKH